MGLITPDFGLLFWMLVSFSILMFILKKYAWKPILHGIKNREEYIAKALREADFSKNELAKLEERKAEMLVKIQAERDAIIAQAKEKSQSIIDEATRKAMAESDRFLEKARITIKREKEAAQQELKAYTTKIVLTATERILRQELKNKDKYEDQIDSIIKELSSQN
jgi:F-type H+-transporting ATPase subunit b